MDKIDVLGWVVIGILLVLMVGCLAKPTPRPYPNTIITIESEIPVTVWVEKDCEGNWNFCDYERW